MKEFWKMLRIFIWMLLLTGVAYPLILTAIARIAMHERASGSMIMLNGKPIGSKLVAQKFESAKYFWPRPSAVDYNPLPSGGSNLGPTSRELAEAVAKRRLFLSKTSSQEVPANLLFASGSGLDPHISPAAAYFQIERVARARNLSDMRLKALVEEHIEQNIFGVSCVNVLMLNLALEALNE